MSGREPIERIVEIVTSSEASTSSPPYLVAKRPRLVAVGRASIKVQTLITASGKPRDFSKKKVATGPMMSWTAAGMMSRHFLIRCLRWASESIKPIQRIESGVVALPTKEIVLSKTAGSLKLIRKRVMPIITATILGLIMVSRSMRQENLCLNR